ncbi:hypothetical protein ABFA07_012732 [Porites harrisoni]
MFRRQLLFFSTCFLLCKPLLAFREIGDANDENHLPDEVIGLSHQRPSEIGNYNCVCGFTTWRCCRRKTGKRQLSKQIKPFQASDEGPDQSDKKDDLPSLPEIKNIQRPSKRRYQLFY